MLPSCYPKVACLCCVVNLFSFIKLDNVSLATDPLGLTRYVSGKTMILLQVPKYLQSHLYVNKRDNTKLVDRAFAQCRFFILHRPYRMPSEKE